MVRSQIAGEVAGDGLQRGFGDGHSVVPRHDLLGGVVGQADDAATLGHERLGAFRHRNQAVGADVEGHLETLARNLDEAPAHVFPAGEGDRMHQNIDLAEPRLHFVEHGVKLVIVADITHFDEVTADGFGQREDALFQRLGSIAQRDGCPLFVQFLHNPPSDGVLVGHAENQRHLAIQQSHGVFPP